MSRRASSRAPAMSPQPTIAQPGGPQPPWALLATVPLLSADDSFRPGTNVSVNFADPPRVSNVAVPRRIAPNYAPPDGFPYVAAVAASSHRFLLYATQAAGLAEFGERAPACFLCDASAGSAARLPYPATAVLRHDSVGLIVDPRADAHSVVAQLRPVPGAAHRAALLRYRTATDNWDLKEVRGDFRDFSQWGCDGVIAHEGWLWWVDLSYGLQACDPFADSPCLRHVSLPPGSVMVYGRVGLDRNRCVRVSAGKLRYVHLQGHPWEMEMVVTMWTLEGVASEAPRWEREYEVPLAEIWADKSYVDTKMPKAAPRLAAVNPQNPREVYFFMDAWIFAVDVPAKRVVQHGVCQLVHPRTDLFSSRYVHAWLLPPPAPAATSSDSGGQGPNGKEGASRKNPIRILRRQQPKRQSKLTILKRRSI